MLRFRFAWMALSALTLWLSAGPVEATSPRFTNILPRGVQRGTEAEVILYGSNLADAEELLLYDSGMAVLSLEQPEDDKQKGRQLKVKLKVDAQCPLGRQRLRIRTRTGITEIQNLYVGTLPVVQEKEPNTDFTQPQVIENNVTVQGRVDREDVDYYLIEAKKGERITAEVFGMRLGYSSGGNYFDPYLAILDKDRFELAISDDSPLVWNDAVVSVIAPEDGQYIIQIRDASYFGDGRAYYLLSIGNFPRPLGAIPSGGRPGETLAVTFVGDINGPITREVTLPTEIPERFGLEVQDDYGTAPSLQPFRVSDLPGALEQEPNNDRTKATPAEAPGAYNGVISEPGDIDFFKFTAKKGAQFDIEVYARRIRSPLDPVLYVYQADNGKGIGSNDDSRGPDSFFRVKIPADGEYVVAVRDHLQRGGPTYTYRIEVTPVAPKVTGEPIEFRRYVQPDIVIPQGSGSGVVVNVRRQDFGGPIGFRSDDLPPGVRIECPKVWRSGGTMPVIFFAEANAPVGGKYSHITIYSENENLSHVTGPLMQKKLMIRGRNNNRVWEERMTRLPIVVTEKLPFRVWIDPPKVPLVRGGSMQLRVLCEKDEGWDEDISIRLLQNPSGVSASGSVKIPKGKTEALIPMNASGGAAVQETMISVRCNARVGNGTVEVCTPFAPLRVEEQYFTFEFTQAAVEQGKEIVFPVKVKKRKDFEGEAEVRLLGLPANTTAENLKLTKDTQELVFTIKSTEKTPPGMNKNLFCQVLVPEAGVTVLHNLGSGVLRVDKPLPPKKNQPKPKPQPVAKKTPPKRPLSRLEMLRQQQKEREAAGGDKK